MNKETVIYILIALIFLLVGCFSGVFLVTNSSNVASISEGADGALFATYQDHTYRLKEIKDKDADE